MTMLSNMSNSPIALFVYNRPEHTKLTVESLQKNIGAPDSPLYIFSDAARNSDASKAVSEVRSYIHTIEGFDSITIIEREINLGLANSIISGVSQLCDEYGRVIVLEDDLVTSQYFLSYMNAALERYQDIEKVMSISAFGKKEIINSIDFNESYDAYFVPRNSSWGWGTWKNSWLRADWEVKDYASFKNDIKQRKKFSAMGEDLCLMLDLQQYGLIDSWAIRWTFAHYMNNGVSLVPYHSYVGNIGFDGSGTNCKVSEKFVVDLSYAKKDPCLPISVILNEDLQNAFRKAHSQSFLSRLYWKIKLLGRRIGIL